MTRLRALALLLIVCLVTGCPRDPGPVEGTSTTAGATDGASATSETPTVGDGTGEVSCGCAPTSPTFCAAMVELCIAQGLDFSAQAGPDFCGAFAQWCADGTSGDTCATCGFLQATCDEFSQTPDKCAGLQDECACLCSGPVPGELWGPCTPDKHCVGEESGLFGCMYVPNPDAPQGSLCAPLCTVAGACEQADEAIVCGEAIGTPACEKTGACALVCASDAECGPGLGCFGTRCLWVE